MEFLDFSDVVITQQLLEHVCFGAPDNPGKGGHISGMKREGKTEFPASWDEDRIYCALRAVLERPQYVLFEVPHTFLRRTVADVMVEVELRQRKSGLVLFAAYPLFGEGVMQNILGNQHHIPRLDSRKGK